ncbi:MAG: flagellar biosynthetic protein FliO [Syntrophobacterales bacterium]|nr:flagellar biosynthetic protein FliO [Syntrophobacterales bacterium]
MAVGGEAAALAARPDAPGSLAGELLRVLGVLLGLLGLLVVGLHLARRLRLAPASRPPLIQVLSTHYLATRQALWVVAVGRQRFLLASSPERVELLTALPPGEEPSAGEPGPQEDGP